MNDLAELRKHSNSQFTCKTVYYKVGTHKVEFCRPCNIPYSSKFLWSNNFVNYTEIMKISLQHP